MGTRGGQLILTSRRFLYTFTLISFKITDTRSQRNDTDFVSIGVTVGRNPPISVPTKSMGDVNNGTHAVNLSIPDVDVPAGQRVAFSYSIVNIGHDRGNVQQALQKFVAAASSKAVGANAIGGLVGGPIGTGIAIIGTQARGWVASKLENTLFVNCDGTVAAADHIFEGAQLAEQTEGGQIISGTDDNKGADSPLGCGGNSHYFVSWLIAARQQVVVRATIH